MDKCILEISSCALQALVSSIFGHLHIVCARTGYEIKNKGRKSAQKGSYLNHMQTVIRHRQENNLPDSLKQVIFYTEKSANMKDIRAVGYV